jgi:uncharacterized protein (TIGR03086 family)
MLDLEAPANEITKLLDDITDDQLSASTPCENTTVGDLLDHFMGLTLAFTYAARKSWPGGSAAQSPRPQASAANLDPEWGTVFQKRLDELVTAWKDAGAWEGMTEAGGVTMPAEMMGSVALDELVLHGWDLARGTGQPFDCDPASIEVVHGSRRRCPSRGRKPAARGCSGPPSRCLPTRPCSTGLSGSAAATPDGRLADRFRGSRVIVSPPRNRRQRQPVRCRSAVVDLASVPNRDDDNEQYVVGHCVDDAVVTYPDTETGPSPQRTGARRPRILRQ